MNFYGFTSDEVGAMAELKTGALPGEDKLRRAVEGWVDDGKPEQSVFEPDAKDCEIGKLRSALVDIADPTLTADECKKIAREVLGWEAPKTEDATLA